MNKLRLLILILLLTSTALLVSYSRAEQSACSDDQKEVLELRLNEVLIIESAEGKAEIWFIKFGGPEEESTYKWNFRAKGAEKELSGEGKVFEKYEITETNPDKRLLKNIGSQTLIHAGSVSLEWSYGQGDFFGWIYYDPKILKVTKK